MKDINVSITGGEMSRAEIEYYIEAAKSRNPGKFLTAAEFEIDGEYINAQYHFSAEPFQRIRRITGYLVGTLDRFNNGKRAEERDRVKHGLGQ